MTDTLLVQLPIRIDDHMKLIDTINFGQFKSIMNNCFPEEILDQSSFENNLDRNNYLFAELEGVPCGYLLFDRNVDPTPIIHLCVAKNYRNLGIGGFLLEKLVSILLEEDIHAIVLNVDTKNHGAIRFYESHGFTKVKDSIQYNYQVDDDDISHPESIKIVKHEDFKELKTHFQLGEHMMKYFIKSKVNIFYKVENSEEKIIGYFLYNPTDQLISPLILDNPNDILVVLAALHFILGSTKSISFNSTTLGIHSHLQNVRGLSEEYHLDQMRLNLN